MSQPFQDLDPRLHQALSRLKTVPSRNPRAAARGRANFLAYAKSQVPQRAVATPSSNLLTLLMPRRLVWALAAFLIFALVLGSGEVVVYAAQDTMPNTPLYSVKLWSEDAAVALSTQPSGKRDLLANYAVRRVDEITTLAAQGLPIPEPVIDRLQRQLDQALSLEADLPDAELAQTLADTQAILGNRIQVLAQVETRVAAPAKPVLARVREMLQNKYNQAGQGLNDPANFRKQMHDGNPPVIPPGQPPSATLTPPGQERRQTVIPTAHPQDKTTPPGQERRATVVPTPKPADKEKPAVVPAVPTRRPPTATPGPTQTPQGQGTPPSDPGKGNPPSDPGKSNPPSDPGKGNPPDNPGKGNPPDNPGQGNPPDNAAKSSPPSDPGQGTPQSDPNKKP